MFPLFVRFLVFSFVNFSVSAFLYFSGQFHQHFRNNFSAFFLPPKVSSISGDLSRCYWMQYCWVFWLIVNTTVLGGPGDSGRKSSSIASFLTDQEFTLSYRDGTKPYKTFIITIKVQSQTSSTKYLSASITFAQKRLLT